MWGEGTWAGIYTVCACTNYPMILCGSLRMHKTIIVYHCCHPTLLSMSDGTTVLP